MGEYPVRSVTVLLVGAVFQSMLVAWAGGAAVLENPPPEFEQPDGILELPASIINAIWDTVLFLIGFMTFNITGAPTFIRVLVGGYYGGMLGYIIAGLLRGGK